MTDPPYEIGFMGKAWDGSGVAYNVPVVAGVSRVLKPGGHLLAFGATRSYHRMAVAIEDAGFEPGQYSLDVWLPHRRRRRPHPDGWKRGTDITTGDTIAQWDSPTASSPSPPSSTPTGPGTRNFVRFHSTDTDQLSPPTTAFTTRVRVPPLHRRHRLPRMVRMARQQASPTSPAPATSRRPSRVARQYPHRQHRLRRPTRYLGMDRNTTSTPTATASASTSRPSTKTCATDRTDGPVTHKRYDRAAPTAPQRGRRTPTPRSTWFFTATGRQAVRRPANEAPTSDLL